MTPARVSVVHLILLAALSAIAPLTVDMYLPAFPAIAAELAARPAEVQLTLSLFMAGFAFGQFFYGPIADRFGRMPLLTVGMILFAATSAAAAQSSSIEELTFWRFVQGVGGAAGPVLARAMVRDMYGREDAARLLSLITLIMGLAPMLAPFGGGVVLEALGWRAIFIALAMFGFVIWVWTRLQFPETLAPEKRIPFSPGAMARNFATMLGHRRFVGYVLCSGFSSAALFAYIASSPFIFIEYFRLTPIEFTLAFGTNVTGFMLGAFINSRLVRRFGTDRLLIISTALAAVMGTLVAIATLGFSAGLVVTMVPLYLLMPSISMTGNNAVAGALSEFPTMIGTASSLMGALGFLIGAGSGALAGILYDGTPAAMAGILAAAGVCGLLARWLMVGAVRSWR